MNIKYIITALLSLSLPEYNRGCSYLLCSTVSLGDENSIVEKGVSLYKNDRYEIALLPNIKPNYSFSFSRINYGKVYVDELIYAEGDPKCCTPQFKEHSITIEGNSFS